MSIEVNQISKFYGEQAALNQVSFQVASGEIVGFLGPNGAGKSTLMKILTGFIAASQGTAKVCGLDVSLASDKVRAKVGYLPEHNPLYLDMYVKESLALTAGIHGMKKPQKAIADIIEMTGLGQEQHKKIGALSKGYRQRVGLAQALLHQPEVLILDEPTTGLDPNQLVEIRQLIARLGKERTVLFSSHIMQEVQALCNRVIILHHGKVVADGSFDALSQNLTSFVLTVEFNIEIARERLLGIPGLAAEGISGQGRHWELRSKSDLREALFQWAVGEDLKILSIVPKQENLEMLFRRLTGNTENTKENAA